jgi:Cdc6-like AAA superfamily ATPase
MKTNQMIEISNVKRADSVYKSLLDRTRSESVGIGLYYGRPGLGKTRWAFRTANKGGHIFLRLIENMTVKDFLKELVNALKYKHLPVDVMHGTQKQLYDAILDVLQSNPDIVIFIDEIDYAFKKHKILATLRDLADQSMVTLILTGMQDAKAQLTKMNAHYFDRCNGFCEFKPLNLEDVAEVVKGVCDVELDASIVEFIYNMSNGTMRLVNKYIETFEMFAQRAQLSALRHSDVKELLKSLG